MSREHHLIPALGKPPRKLRELIREHLNHARINQAQLAAIWGIHHASARRLLYPAKGRRNEIGPEKIDQLVIALKLDEFDAYELHVAGALEAGYRINKP